MGFFNEKFVKFCLIVMIFLIFIDVSFCFINKSFAYTNTDDNSFYGSNTYYYIRSQIKKNTVWDFDTNNLIIFYFNDENINGYRVVTFYRYNSTTLSDIRIYPSMSKDNQYWSFDIMGNFPAYAGLYTIFNDGSVEFTEHKFPGATYEEGDLNDIFDIGYYVLNPFNFLYYQNQNMSWSYDSTASAWNTYFAKKDNISVFPFITFASDNKTFVIDDNIIINPGSSILTLYNSSFDLFVYPTDTDNDNYIIHTTLSTNSTYYDSSSNTYKIPISYFNNELKFGTQYTFYIRIFTGYDYFVEDLLTVNWNNKYIADGNGNIPSTPDYSQSLDNINSSINDTNDFLKDDSYDQQGIADSMPSNTGVNDVTEQPLDNLFNSLRNAFTSTDYVDLVIDLPFVNQSITIPYDFISSHIPTSIVSLIQLVYWFVISRFIFKDINSYISKLKSGDITDSHEGNIKADML